MLESNNIHYNKYISMTTDSTNNLNKIVLLMILAVLGSTAVIQSKNSNPNAF